MRIIAAIEDPIVARNLLENLKLPARAPPLEPAAKGPLNADRTEDEWCFDQSPVHDEP